MLNTFATGLHYADVQLVKPYDMMELCTDERDLKPENPELDELGNLKIYDFGQIIHEHCQNDDEHESVLCFQVLAAGHDGKKADAWSIGVILYALLAGFMAFDECTISR